MAMYEVEVLSGNVWVKLDRLMSADYVEGWLAAVPKVPAVFTLVPEVSSSLASGGPLDLELAARIIEAFGPCTTLYECTMPSELVEQHVEHEARSPDETLGGFLRVLLDVESIEAERMGDVCYREWIESRPVVLERLAALGLFPAGL